MRPTTEQRLSTNATVTSSSTVLREDCVSRTGHGAATLQYVEVNTNHKHCGYIQSSIYTNLSMIFLISEIRCKEPELSDVLSAQVSTHSVGGIAHYACPRGFNMEGNYTRVCLQNGSWSGSIPACFCESW